MVSRSQVPGLLEAKPWRARALQPRRTPEAECRIGYSALQSKQLPPPVVGLGSALCEPGPVLCGSARAVRRLSKKKEHG